MSRKPPRRRYKGSQVTLDFLGADYLDAHQHLATLIHGIGAEIAKDPERPDIKPTYDYRIEVTFEELGERGRA